MNPCKNVVGSFNGVPRELEDISVSFGEAY